MAKQSELRTRVVSWKDAAEINGRVYNDAFVMQYRIGNSWYASLFFNAHVLFFEVWIARAFS
ncbi:hypothetical protein FACS189449_07680 [Alphaproteobacteria bacterium]|nr:hypothetical protein FACS189449_07680 [Alphaproteobacteria bacterium]